MSTVCIHSPRVYTHVYTTCVGFLCVPRDSMEWQIQIVHAPHPPCAQRNAHCMSRTGLEKGEKGRKKVNKNHISDSMNLEWQALRPPSPIAFQHLVDVYTPKKDIKLYAYSSQTVWGKSIVLENSLTCAYSSGKCAYSSKCLPKQKVFDQTIGKTIWTSSKHFFSSSQTCK